MNMYIERGGYVRIRTYHVLDVDFEYDAGGPGGRLLIFRALVGLRVRPRVSIVDIEPIGGCGGQSGEVVPDC